MSAIPRPADLSQRLRAMYRAVDSRRSLSAILVGLFTVAYFAATCDLASLKPFGFDELTTYNIARMPTLGAVWGAWFESGDAVGPLAHLTTHAVGSALGFSHITARLPEMVGFWLMCLCIFGFLRRRVPPMLAVIGLLLPVTVPAAHAYAYESRGYGMVLGLLAVAVVCWDLARDAGRWRPLVLLGLPLSLGAAIAIHLYAVLVVIPLTLGELARTIERRRIDWPVWMGLAVVGLWFLPVNPVIAKLRRLPEMTKYTVGGTVSLSRLMDLWPLSLSISATYLGLFALVCLLHDRPAGADDPPPPSIWDGPPPLSDWVLVISLTALPAVGWLLANLVTGSLLFRYVLAAVIGFSLGVPLLCAMGIARRPEAALLLAVWVAATAAGSTIASRYSLRMTFTTAHVAAGRGCMRLFNAWEKLPAADLPIVVSDFYVFHQLHHYAPEQLKARLVFLVDREFSGLVEPMIPFYARVFGEHMETFDGFVRSHPAFYLYDCGSVGKLPLVDWLLGSGASLRDSGLAERPEGELRRELYRVSVADRSTVRDPTR